MVNIGATDMLKRLASGVRPDASIPPSATAPVESMDFSSLLRSVDAGEFTSGRPVQIAQRLIPTLDATQLERLAVATDAAEAAGSRRLLAMIDGHALTVDVPSRAVIAAQSSESLSGALLTEIDGFVLVPDARAAELRALFSNHLNPAARSANGTPGAHAPSGPGAITNESLVALLTKLEARLHARSEQPGRAA